MEEEIDLLTTASDGESSNRPEEVLRLDWEWCLCHSSLGGSVEEALTPFSTVSWAKFREAASIQDRIWTAIGHEGQWNDGPGGYYHRNCYKSYTLPCGVPNMRGLLLMIKPRLLNALRLLMCTLIAMTWSTDRRVNQARHSYRRMVVETRKAREPVRARTSSPKRIFVSFAKKRRSL